MAIVVTLSNHVKYMMAIGEVDLVDDVLKVILMNTTFVFDKDTHATLAAVTSDQLASGNGYTQNDKTLTTKAVAEDDAGDKATFTCDDPAWTASGGDIGPFGAMIVYDDTTADDTVIACVDFGADYTIVNGTSFTAQDLVINLS